jgi:hypothetical protein
MVVAEMVGEAIDVVLHQAFDEKDGKRRVSEIIEVNKPGAFIHPNGSVEYRFRTLVAWEARIQDWVFPKRPSPSLLNTLQFRNLDWPQESLDAPEIRGREGAEA